MTTVMITKSVDSEIEAKVFNIIEDYIFFKFIKEVSNLLLVYIRNLETDEYFKFPINPELINNVFSQTNIYYIKFNLSPLFEKQDENVNKWRIDIYEEQKHEFIKIKEHFITLNKTPKNTYKTTVTY